MTTPEVDLNIVMPYGVTVRGTGFSNPAIVGNHPRKVTNVALGLVPGPCRVSASWEGPESVGLFVQNKETGTSRQIGVISAGGGHGPSWCPSGRSRATRCTSPERNQPESPEHWRSILSAQPSSGRGGGVGDRTDFGSSSEAAGRWFGNNADYSSARFPFGLRSAARGRFRFGCHLAGACPGRGRSSARYHLQFGAHGNRLCGSGIGCGASRSRTGRLRNAAVGVLSILWGARFERSVVGAGDSGELDRRGVISATGGGCAK